MVTLDGGTFDNFFKNELNGEVFSSLIVVLIIVVVAIIVGIKARHADPLKKPKGILFLAETGVGFFENLAVGLMGERWRFFGGYIMGIASYLFLAFIFGLTGLPSPVTNLAVPLSVGLSTFVLIHFTALKYQRWGYFKRYVEPIPVFLPINLVTVWAPLLSLTFRLFGNAISGWVLMSIVYEALQSLSAMIFSFIPAGFNEIFLAPIITPLLHCYFDLFSGFIQTTVFIFLTMIFVGQEGPEDPEEVAYEMTEGGKR